MGAWRAAEGGLTAWRPQFQNPSAQLHDTLARRRHASRPLRRLLPQPELRAEARELGQRPREEPASATGRASASGSRTLDVGGHSVDARTAELGGPGGERLVAWYWYWIDGRLTASDAWAKAYTALSRLMGRGDDSAVVIVYARKERPGEAEAALATFVRDAGPAIEAMLAETRARR